MTFIFDETNTFCISLESNQTRWENMQRRFSRLNLRVTKYNACVANTSDVVDNFYEVLGPSEKACAQSHINLWRHIKNCPTIKYALILEDDACFDKEWEAKLAQFYVEPVNDWDLILLNASEPIEPIHKWSKVTDQYLTGGYIISQQGVSALLETFTNCYYSSDWMTSRIQHREKSYSYFPWLIIQEGRDSTIRDSPDADYEKVVRCLKKIDYDVSNYVM